MKPTKVVVMNASPKGEFSLTLQHARYLLVHEPDIEASIIHVGGEKLTMMEYDEAWLSDTFDAIAACDMVIWLHRCIPCSCPGNWFGSLTSQKNKENSPYLKESMQPAS